MEQLKNIQTYLGIDEQSPTGLVWVARPAHAKVVVGTPALTTKRDYYGGTLCGQQVQAHRAVFALHNGYLPPLVDHEDGDVYNNRPGNLRDATCSMNQHNQVRAGCYQIAGKWRARIMRYGVNHWLGTFPTEEAAHAAYLTAKKELHPTAPDRCYKESV